jgi:hypothetical protein
LLAGAIDNVAAGGLSGEIKFSLPSNGTIAKRVFLNSLYRPSTGGWAMWDGFGIGPSTAVTDIRILPGAGVVTGTASLYGIRYQ